MVQYPAFLLLSSLDKVFPDEIPLSSAREEMSVLQKEVFSFQVAYTAGPEEKDRSRRMEVSIDCLPEDRKDITLRLVGLVPSELPVYPDRDEDYLRTAPGLFPDPLLPLQNPVRLLFEQWRSIWVQWKTSENTAPGLHRIRVLFHDAADHSLLGEVTQSIQVIPAVLPEQTLIHTEWFHSDCLCDYYRVPAFCEEHWRILENYISAAADHGVNMLLTPLFTPPLDTQIGGERTTVQLIGVEKTGNSYRFDFDDLRRWMDLCRRCGIEYLEMSHLFTQWGAKCTPKILATVDGKQERIFGWDVPAQSASYREFLSAFLPQLAQVLKSAWDPRKIYFHVSDEPHLTHLEDYQYARQLMEPWLKDFQILDALSDLRLYENGAVTLPVPSVMHAGEFIDHGVQPRWVYYSCVAGDRVTNRFMAMPGCRMRILGCQLYWYQIQGFLHWGFNFWNSAYSLEHIDPYAVTDARCAMPSGDAFLVYPGENGTVVESLRLTTLLEAMQDLRALSLLEALTSREAVMDLLRSLLPGKFSFYDYPRDPQWIPAMRQAVNRAIASAAAQAGKETVTE